MPGASVLPRRSSTHSVAISSGQRDVTFRRPVAILVSRFPLITETFVLRELIELERQGQPIELVRLIREDAPIRHREADAWSARAIDARWMSRDVLAANLRTLHRQPTQYLTTLCRVLRETASSPGFLVRTLALFPKTVLLAERLRDRGVGHLHAHFATHPTTMAFVISRLTGIPFSFTVHAHDLFVDRTMIERKIEEARFVRVISNFNRQYLASHCSGIRSEKLEVIPVGVPVSDDQPYGTQSAQPVSDPLRLLSVAALKPYKGVPLLIEACRRLRAAGVSFECDLVGEGPMRREIERQIAECGLDRVVHLLGARPQHEVAELIGRASVVILPSIVARDGQMDGIPVCLMEAMAAGKPVVCSRLSGIPELVEHGVSGLLAEPGNVDELVAHILLLHDRSDIRTELGRTARRQIERGFRLDHSVSRLLASLDRFNERVRPPGAACHALRHFDLLAGRALGVRRVHERQDSVVMELISAEGGPHRELVLKVQWDRPGQSAEPLERARKECAALSSLAHHFARTQPDQPDARREARTLRWLGVPAVLEFDADEGAILMERCTGSALDRLIREARWNRSPAAVSELASSIRDAGRWLQQFQACEALVDLTAPRAAAALNRAMEALDACRRAGLLGRRHGRVTDRLRQRWDAMSASSRASVPHHGDFWPGNIYIAHDSIHAIDFEGLRSSLRYEDAAYFVVHLDLYFAYPLLQRRARRFRAAFLEGFLGRETVDRAAYDFHRLAAAIELLARSVGADGRRAGDGMRQQRVLRAIAAWG